MALPELRSLAYVCPTRVSVNYHLRASPRDLRRLSNPVFRSPKLLTLAAALRCPINARRRPKREARHVDGGSVRATEGSL